MTSVYQSNKSIHTKFGTEKPPFRVTAPFFLPNFQRGVHFRYFLSGPDVAAECSKRPHFVRALNITAICTTMTRACQ